MKMFTISLIISAGLGALIALPLQAQSAGDVSPNGAVSNFDPAAIMPADTKVYLEFGSPGKQFETVLKLFEGTPLEDSLSALLNQHHDDIEDPARIIQAILNPAMMKEFKKIRGAAIGITGFHEDMPEFVAVLSPGESDALRGVLAAGICVAGAPGESFLGMQSWKIKDVGAAAYDNNIFIVVNPAEKLKETIDRYKNHSTKSSLADSKWFQQLDRQKRSANVVTVWINGQESWREFAGMMEESGDKEELAVFNMIADPNHIEEALLQLSIIGNDVVLDIHLSLDENHQCYGYNLIRTPHLTLQGMASVPSDAIALVSFALGDADGPGAQKVQGALKQITGLDIGREIFSNIEQINVFVVEPGNVTDIRDFPAASIGISITSKDGRKTKDFLNILFQTSYQAMRASGEIEDLPAQTTEGQYIIPVDDMRIPCYLEQKGNITVLSLSRQIISHCFDASENQKVRVTAGLLKPVLDTLPPTTGKVIAVNAGGLLRMADTIAIMDNKNPHNPAHQQLIDFSRLLDTMNICVRTSETPTQFNLNASINDIPPLGPLFPKAAALTKCDFSAKGCASNPVPCNHGAVAPGQSYILEWKPAIGSKTHKVYFGDKPSELKLLKEISDINHINGPLLADGIETCYWRVDGILPDGTVITGDVWDFSKGSIIGHWKLNEASGVTAGDASGHNHHGSLTGQAVWRPSQGIRSGAVELDGIDDTVEIDGLSFITNNATFTAWIKGQKTADWGGILFSRTRQPCGMHFGANNTLHYTWNNNSPATYNWNGGPVIPTDEWVFVAIVVRPDGTIAYVYDKNNGLQSAENAVPNIPQRIDNLKIGWDSQQEARRFKGLVDDVRVYNYALSRVELNALVVKEDNITHISSMGNNQLPQ